MLKYYLVSSLAILVEIVGYVLHFPLIKALRAGKIDVHFESNVMGEIKYYDGLEAGMIVAKYLHYASYLMIIAIVFGLLALFRLISGQYAKAMYYSFTAIFFSINPIAFALWLIATILIGIKLKEVDPNHPAIMKNNLYHKSF